MKDLKSLVFTFAAELQTLIETEVIARARASVLTAMGIAAPKKPGRPPKALVAVKPAGTATARKKAPLQLCPVPGCKNAAAPIFGMVCAKHKDLPKATIKKYREARKAKKLKAAGKATTKARRTKARREAAPRKTARTSPAKKAAARRPKAMKARAKRTTALTAPTEATTSPAPTGQAA